jgi:hypothetical protein
MNLKRISRVTLLATILATFALAFGGPFRGTIPATQAAQQQPAKQDQNSQSMPNMPNMPGMDHMPGMGGDQVPNDPDHHAEAGAMSDMSHHHHMMGAHMYMTKLRTPATPEDWAKADDIAQQLRESIEKYKDYHAALAEDFHIFAPNFPQPEYHFTSYRNGYLETFTFDPGRPTSLLYRKTKTGYELIGAMYTMPRRSTEEQLNARIPLSIAQWHLHTNLCMPGKGQTRPADWTKFGFEGTIATEDACKDAGGNFYPVIFGWMVHVYPFESSREKIWGQ